MAHHERPDGKGYLRRLTDRETRWRSKILAVGDAYEAMTSNRVYRPGIGDRAARGELLRYAGTQFDARVVAAFLSVLSRFDAEQGESRFAGVDWKRDPLPLRPAGGRPVVAGTGRRPLAR